MLEQHPHGIQRPGHGDVGGGAQQVLQPQHLLVQLAGVEEQGSPAQILRDILGDLVLAHLQALAQLHHHLVALLPAQQGDQADQGLAGGVADAHPLGHLHQVGEVGGDVEHVLPQAVLHLVLEQLDAHHLDDPVCGALQVVQEDLTGHVLLIQGRLIVGHVLPRPLEDLIPQEEQRQAPAGGRPGGRRDLSHLGVILGQGALGLPQEPEGRRLEAQVAGGGEPGRKADEAAPGLLVILLGGQIADGVQQGEGGILVLLLRPVIVAQQRPDEAGHGLAPAVLQQGVHHQLQGIADLAPLLGGGLVQMLLPQGEGHLLRRVSAGVGRHLLAVDQVEFGDDLSDEAGCLAPDIPLPVDQQLIEEGQGLGLLPHGQIGAVLVEHIQIGPQLLPALGRAGGLDDVAELPLAAQLVHQLQVVLYRQQDQAVHRLVRGHQGRVLGGLPRPRLPGQVYVHSQRAHVVLEVVELAVDELIPAALCLVHILQLPQDDVEGLLQGIEDGGLPPLLIPSLLAAEVGVDQTQGLYGEGVQLQVPGGVVGSDVADGGHPPPQQPLVGVVVVEERDTLPGPAAELAQVVGGGGSGHQRQVYVLPRLPDAPGHGHGDVMHPRDVPQGAEGGGLLAQPHHLIDVLLPEGGQEAAVLLPALIFPHFL